MILGSGYGAAVAASQLAHTHRDDSREIVLLERGNEYLPGSFPETAAELPAHLRISPVADGQVIGNKRGLFDMRLGKHMNCLIANGLGGGSLINAGVMRRPPAHIYDNSWPQSITQNELEPYLTQAELMLGSHTQDNTKGINVPVTVNLETELQAHSKTRLLEQSVKQHRQKNTNTTFTFEPAALTVAVSDGKNQSGVELSKCINCADCATGCNHNAKNSLDVNLLTEAYRDGATLVTGVTALKLVNHSSENKTLWQVDCRFTNDKLHQRDTGDESGLRSIYAHNVLVCCGALGSTELLLKSQSDSLKFSSRLGHNFSGNGDLLAFYPSNHFADSKIRPKSSARPHIAPDQRHIGPTIGGVVSTSGRKTSGLQSLLIEEMAIPGTIRIVFEQIIELNRYLRGVLTNFQKTPEQAEKIHPDAVDHSGIYAAIGNDQSKGVVSQLDEDHSKSSLRQQDGVVRVDWTDFSAIEKLFNEQTHQINQLFDEKPDKTGVLPNPMWKLFERLQRVLRDQYRPNTALSVHPLGGCSMADKVTHGVTDSMGRVFNGAAGGAVHKGLFVLDGAIVPRALSANPALTISALTLRAVEQLNIRQLFNFPDNEKPATAIEGDLLSLDAESDVASTTRRLPRTRPRITKDKNQLATNVQSRSRFTLLERLGGEVSLKIKGVRQTVFLELTIKSAAKNLNEFTDATFNARADHEQFIVSPAWHNSGYSSTLRIFKSRAAYEEAERQALLRHPNLSAGEFEKNWQGDRSLFDDLLAHQNDHEKILTEAALAVVSLSGNVRVLHTKPFAFFRRAQTGVKKFFRLGVLLWHTKSIRLTFAATQWRYLTYSLSPKSVIVRSTTTESTQPLVDSLYKKIWQSIEKDEVLLVGEKCVFSDQPETIITQLSEVNIRQFPFFTKHRHSKHGTERLVLDPKLFATTGHPLIAVEEQSNLVDSFSDLASFSLFCLKRLLPIHAPAIAIASRDIFASPSGPQDPVSPDPAAIDRTPGHIIGADRTLYLLQVPETLSESGNNQKTERLNIYHSGEISSVFIGLTRYQQSSSSLKHARQKHRNSRSSILLVHGYIAGGNTFTHHSLEVPLAQTLTEQGYDVWVLDMRDSCRFYNQAQKIWTFEQVAQIDIRTAIDFVCRISGRQTIQVLAHCIGSAKFSLAMLLKEKNILDFSYEAKNTRDWFPHSKTNDTQTSLLPETADAGEASSWQTYSIADTHPAERIEKAVLSQVTPILSVSDGNLVRAYLLDNWLKFTNVSAYQLQYRDDKKGLALATERLVDVALRMIPYAYDKSDERLNSDEFKEPMRIRRRMDLLYNKVFELKHTSDATLHHLDELFGPVNLHTLMQGVHFAREKQITGHLGEGVSYHNNRMLENIEKQWKFPTLCLIGADNKVFHPDGFHMFKQKVDTAKLDNFELMEPIKDYGHQDAFTGTRAHVDVHPEILQWLDGDQDTINKSRNPGKKKPVSQRKYVSALQRISYNLQATSNGLALTLRRNDLPSGMTTIRLLAKKDHSSAVYDYRYLHDKKYTDNGAEISHDRASILILVSRERAPDLFEENGNTADIDIQFDALIFSSQISE